MAHFTLRQLGYFVAAAETESIGGAAKRVHVSQSAVSTSLADLERSFGVQLLIRGRHGLTLTAAGRRVLVDARRLLAAADDLHNTARDTGHTLTGSLAVGCYSTLAPILMPRVVADFARRHPDVELDFIEGSAGFLEDQLRAGRCEVVLLYNYDFKSGLLPTDFALEVVAQAPPHVLLPHDHRLVASERVRLAELLDEPLILFDLEPGGEYFLGIFERLGLKPNIRIKTASFEMVRSLVARGLGYALLTQRTKFNTSYEGRRFVTKPLADPLPGLQIVVARLADVHPTRRATAFQEQCIASLSGFDLQAEVRPETSGATSSD